MGLPTRFREQWREMSGKRLSPKDRERAGRLRAVGTPVAGIARELQCSRQSVERALSKPEALAAEYDCRAALKQHRQRFVELWPQSCEAAARAGRHKPMLDALLSIKAIDHPNPPPVLVPSAGLQVQIVNGILPGLPQPAGGVIPLPSAVPRENSAARD